MVKKQEKKEWKVTVTYAPISREEMEQKRKKVSEIVYKALRRKQAEKIKNGK